MEHDFQELRARALEALANDSSIDPTRWGTDVKNLVDELSVHQIELEYQNEELVRTHAELQNSLAETKDLFDNSPTGQLIVDKDHVILKANKTFSKMLYYEKEELFGSEIDKFISPLYKDTCYHFFKLLMKGDMITHVDVKLRSPRRSDLAVRLDGTSTKEANFIRLSVTDISLQKKMEEQLRRETEKALMSETKFRQIVENSSDLFYYQEIYPKRITYISPTVLDVFGYSADEFMNMTDSDILGMLHKDDRESYVNLVHNLLEAELQENHNVIREFRFATKSGKVKWIHGSYTLLKDFEGNPKQILATLHDISADKALSAELKKQKEKAEKSDYMKSAFLANISHDIRTPLNAILGFTDLLKEELDFSKNEEQAQYLSLIEKSGQALSDLINNLIYISKVEAGQMPVIVSEFDINSLLRDTFDTFSLETSKKGLALAYNHASEPLIISTDRDKLISCINNLIKNAIKYTDSGTIEFGYEIDFRDILHFHVKDTGKGVAKEKKPFIFDRFAQATHTKSVEGVGLGLNIVQSTVQLLKGDIGFESEEGKGSNFHFSIPVKIIS